MVVIIIENKPMAINWPMGESGEKERTKDCGKNRAEGKTRMSEEVEEKRSPKPGEKTLRTAFQAKQRKG